MIRETDKYYQKQEEPNKSCLLALREIILEQESEITESIKWSIPCFSYKKKICCFLNIDKKTNQPYLLMSNGNLLQHPSLEFGNRSQMKSINFDPNEDIPLDIVEDILEEALNLFRNGVVKAK